MKALTEIKKLMALDKVPKAEAALKEILAKEPDNLQAKMLFGLCRQLLGDEETFRRIYDEVAPKMERLPPSEQRSETVSLWKKYRTLWKSLIVGGLVLAGTAVAAVMYFGRTPKHQMAVADEVMTGYRGPSYYGNEKRPDDSVDKKKHFETIDKKSDD